MFRLKIKIRGGKLGKRFLLVMVAAFIFALAPIIQISEASAATPSQVVNQAKKLTGIKYVWGGTTTSGFDCSGFTSYVFKSLNINLNRTAAAQATQGTSVSKSNLKEGDLVFFAGTGGKGRISHVGIYIGNGNMVSATSSRGTAIDNINTNPYWAPRYSGAKRIAAVKDEVVIPVPAPEPVLPPITDGNFPDIATSHLAYEAIKTLNIKGIISGFPNQEFRPNQQVTRGQAAVMINRVLGYTPAAASPYSDVGTTHNFSDSIAAMTENGILAGYSNGQFGVDDSLTKAQLAIILNRAFDIVAKVDESVHAATTYNNVTTATPSSREILALKAMDETSVFQTSEIQFNSATTRAEFSAALYSAMELQ